MKKVFMYGKRFLVSCGLAFSLYVAGWICGIIAGRILSQAQILQTFSGHLQTHTSAWFYITHNLTVAAILILSAALPFLGPGMVLFGNGLLQGTIAVPIALKYGLPFLLAGLLPHGIFEMLAWIVAGTASFLLSQRIYALLIQTFFPATHERLPAQEVGANGARSLLRQLLILGGSVVLLICLAGCLEAYVSPVLAEHFLP